MPTAASKDLLTALKQAGAKNLTESGLDAWLDGLAAVPARAGDDPLRERFAALLDLVGDGANDALAEKLAKATQARQVPPPTQQPPDHKRQAARLKALRQALKAAKVDAFIVPRADRFQGEQVPPGDERLAWLTGFTGSAGLAVVTADAGAMVVDGRYTLQVRQQVSGDLYQFPEFG
ncbi:MAG: aminopeptidase P family N-terminal domain-containing protein, partial [Pseudomonadota bacterium]